MANDIVTAIEKAKKEANDYEQTVLALFAFANHVCWDESSKSLLSGSQFSFGKGMINQDGKQVTPDLIVQRTENYGIVAEAKKSLPQEKKYWLKEFQQLKSYDGELKGWFTPTEEIDIADLVLLIHQTRGPAASRFLSEKIDEGTLSFLDKISVITFVVSAEVQEFLNLQKIWGKMSFQNLERSFEDVRPVALETLTILYGGVKLYDAEPPLPYFLQILWDHVFNRMKENLEYDERRKCVPIPISLDALTKYLQDYFGSPKHPNREREPEIPKKGWVAKALETLCFANMAEQDSSNPNTYVIFFKRKRQDTLEMFTKICYEVEHKSKRREKGKQLSIEF